MQTIQDTLENLLGAQKTLSQHETKLFEKTQDFIQVIKWIPGLRMVAVSNSLAMYATHPDSDIDLFIITASHRLWLVRTLVILVATLLRVRAKRGDEAGKFCFPFFITDKNFNLKEIAIEKDIYLAYWIMTIKPIYNQNYTYGRFMEVNRPFYENVLNIHLSDEENTALLKKNRNFLTITKSYPWIIQFGKICSPFLSFLDFILGFISRKYIANKIPTESEGIIINNDMIKIHIPDKRKEIRDEVMDNVNG